MEFRLPEALHNQLLAYDPALKSLAKQQQAVNKPESTKKKSKYPIGNINDLIPANIVDPADMQSAVDYINGQTARYKYRVFSAPYKPNQKIVTKAIIYYWESVWVAAWLPAEGEDYLYGISYAISTTNLRRRKSNHIASNRVEMTIDLTALPLKKYGRSDYHVHTQIVTTDTVCHSDRYHWDPFGVFTYSEKGKNIKRECINIFTEQLSQAIVIKWESEGLFARIDKKAGSLDSVFSEALRMFPYKTYEELNSDWVPTVANVSPRLLKDLEIPLEIFMKPFIQKELQVVCTKTIEIFNDPAPIRKYEILKPFRRFVTYLEGIKWIHSLWPNTPIDYYQTYKNALSSIEFNTYRMEYLINENSYIGTKLWIQKHMPVTSMLLIFNKAVQEEELKTGNPVTNLHIYSLRDTFQMIVKVLEAGLPLEPPARWRLTEFHDHVQAEAWKITNKKEDLPQDLFPAPIKIHHKEQTWTFFQPVDTHQLSQWGQAVRNCVGTGGYAEDVKKRKQFIVLCILDNKPKFTIQLKLNQGLMSVHQIAGIGNARLTDDEKSLYTETFREALAIRSAVE
jgi:hypothetical protein